jgi:hypothetical protein
MVRHLTVYTGPTETDLASIPAALKALPQWVLWRGVDSINKQTGEVKLTKIPIHPHTDAKASTTDPTTWGSFDDCVAALPAALKAWQRESPQDYRGGGIGFVFTPDDPYSGIDLDSCRDPETGAIEPWAQEILDAFPTYEEVTPSRTGLHILAQGILPPGGRKKGHIEMYSEGRFFTMTGWQLPQVPATIRACQAALSDLHTRTFGQPEHPKTPRQPVSLSLDDTELLAKAKAAKNGAKFARLWGGDTSLHGEDESAADLALCDELAFWTQDHAQIDRLFRQSGLMRDKWDERRGEQTYGARTIDKALARQIEHYRPPADVQPPSNGTQAAPQPRPGGQAPAPDSLPSLTGAIVSYAALQTLQIPKREVYLDWLSESSLAMVYGPRGVGKTMTLLGISLSLTTGAPFLKWPTQRTTGVLYIDGEMSVDELRTRAKVLAGGREPACLDFLPSELVHARLGRDLTLTSAAARQEIDAALDARPAMRVLILDNASCLFPGISENDKHDWEPINAWFIRLRHRGITVILGHHAGKGGHQRGTSGREDALDTVLALTLPPGHKPEDGCHFFLRFEKSRGLKGPAVEGLDVRFDEMPDVSGWTYQALEVERTERIKLMLADGVPPKIIAEELSISASYVYRQKRYLGL